MDQTTREALLKEAHERGKTKTHWEGCEKEHPWCAVLAMEEELRDVENEREARGEILSLIRDEAGAPWWHGALDRLRSLRFLIAGFHRSARRWRDKCAAIGAAADRALRGWHEEEQRADDAERRVKDLEREVTDLEGRCATKDDLASGRGMALQHQKDRADAAERELENQRALAAHGEAVSDTILDMLRERDGELPWLGTVPAVRDVIGRLAAAEHRADAAEAKVDRLIRAREQLHATIERLDLEAEAAAESSARHQREIREQSITAAERRTTDTAIAIAQEWGIGRGVSVDDLAVLVERMQGIAAGEGAREES